MDLVPNDLYCPDCSKDFYYTFDGPQPKRAPKECDLRILVRVLPKKFPLPSEDAVKLKSIRHAFVMVDFQDRVF